MWMEIKLFCSTIRFRCRGHIHGASLILLPDYVGSTQRFCERQGNKKNGKGRASVRAGFLFSTMVNIPGRSLRWPRNESVGQKVDKWWLDSKGAPIYHAPGECYWQWKNSLTLDLPFRGTLFPLLGYFLSIPSSCLFYRPSSSRHSSLISVPLFTFSYEYRDI